jgi:hypothetical protein
LKQPLFGNKYITSAKKPLFWPHWSQSGFRNVGDIWNGIENKWIDDNMIYNNLKKTKTG